MAQTPLLSTLNRRSFLQRSAAVTLVAAGGGLTAFTGCSSDGNVEENQTAMTSSGFLLDFCDLYVAKELGYFDDAGVDVTLRGGTGGGASIQGAVGGGANYAAVSAVSSITAIVEQQVPLMHIASIRQQSQFFVTSLAGSPIRHPSEFSGKRIGVASTGGSTEILLVAMAALANVDEDDFRRPVAGLGGAALELAKGGNLDAWVELDTNIGRFERDGESLHTFNTDEFAPCPSGAYVVSESLIQDGGDRPERFLRAIKRAMEFASEEQNWGEVLECTKAYNPEVTLEQVEFSMPYIIGQWTAYGSRELLSMNVDDFQRGQDTLRAAGELSRTVSADTVLDTRYIDQLS